MKFVAKCLYFGNRFPKENITCAVNDYKDSVINRNVAFGQFRNTEYFPSFDLEDISHRIDSVEIKDRYCLVSGEIINVGKIKVPLDQISISPIV